MLFADSLDQDVAALKLFLEEVPAFLRARTLAAAQANDTMVRDAYRRTQTLALEAGVHLLNSMVDGALLILANRTRGATISAKDMDRKRKDLEAEIEARLGPKLDGLPGWDQVDKIRLDANALKHRVGITFTEGTDAPLAISDDVSVDEAQLLECLMGARAWLLEIDRRLR